MRTLAGVACVLLSGAVASAQGPSVDAAACGQLIASLKLANTIVTSSLAVAAGQFVEPGARTNEDGSPAARRYADLPAFCRVRLTIRPSADSDIRSEVWLPLAGWNGKLLQVGNGAWGGTIQYGPLAAAVRRGYAGASTDTGHTGSDASFAMGHPEKLRDFGYRAVHETAVHSKATITALYGAAPRLSYFEGCSGGGRQAFMEAQRYPEDFDGIIAGDPNYNRTDGAFQVIGAAQATLSDPASFIPASKYPVLHKAVLNACDALDGLKDGLVADPTRCRFDPAVTACKGADGAGCLTPAQVAAAKRIYAPVMNPKTGEQVFPGLEPGSELGWAATSGGPKPHPMYHDLFRFVVFQDPQWDFRTLDTRAHLDLARAIDNGVLSATSADLKPFVARSGKLLIYHGWADPNISPRASIGYYDRLVDTIGKSHVDNSIRLYMVPGMGHCGGGDGPNVFDMLTAMDRWRDHGIAPAEVVASHSTKGVVDRTRPLCPYPQVAQYRGSGSVDEARNFVCTMP